MIFSARYHAKLLISAEYFVLYGAKALAIPLCYGQQFEVKASDNEIISWKSYSHDSHCWFSAEYKTENFDILTSTSEAKALYLKKLLTAARRFNPDFCRSGSGFIAETKLDYPIGWGLGSSSTLISAIAGWAQINPFDLHFSVSSGSGYDIACATANGPILYQIAEKQPIVESVIFCPEFSKHIFFAYQGRKQDTIQGIESVGKLAVFRDAVQQQTINRLTSQMLGAQSLAEFEHSMAEHEAIISRHTGMKTLKSRIGGDFPGEIKSLGAWGGDFCMLTWHDDTALLSAYLIEKGLHPCFNFNEIVHLP